VLTRAGAVAGVLADDPSKRRFIPAVALMKGSALAELDDLVGACEWLGYGLECLDADADADQRGAVDGDWFALRLVELEMMLGLYGDAWQRLTALENPEKPHATRLAAIRGRAALNATRGDYEGAHQLLNAALSVTERINSRFLTTSVEADRIVVLALGGRLGEATALAERSLEKISIPAAGRRGAWAARSTASIALVLSRLCFDAGNVQHGQRYLELGTSAVQRCRSTYLTAQVELTVCKQRRLDGESGSAEPLCREVTRVFSQLGCRPAEAEATLELARLAGARGMLTSARPLLERARTEFSYLGQPRELSECEAVLREQRAESGDPHPWDDSAFRPPTPQPERTI